MEDAEDPEEKDEDIEDEDDKSSEDIKDEVSGLFTIRTRMLAGLILYHSCFVFFSSMKSIEQKMNYEVDLMCSCVT